MNASGNGGIAIGIDVGTSGVRAALVDATRTPLAWGSTALPIDSRRDPATWWRVLGEAVDSLRTNSDLSSVRALAVDGTSGTVLAVDTDGQPLGPASMYNDQADADMVARVTRVAPPESAAHGATSPLAKLLSLQDRPGIVRMLHQADWIAGRLCGRFDVSDENNALKTGYDPISRSWPAWVADTGARIALLPKIVVPGQAIGRLSQDASARFGLSQDAIVAAGTTDGCAAFCATGANEPGDGVTSLGSTLTIKLLSDRPIFAPRYGIYSHRIGERWLAGGASNSGGMALARYFDTATIAALSARIDPSRDTGLDYYPLPAPGERFPIADPVLAPREAPRPEDDAAFLHGLLEGIARVEALAYQRLAELGAPPLQRLRTVGGGARNTTWTSIRSRLTGATMESARSEDAAVGTAGFALAALGITA